MSLIVKRRKKTGKQPMETTSKRPPLQKGVRYKIHVYSAFRQNPQERILAIFPLQPTLK